MRKPLLVVCLSLLFALPAGATGLIANGRSFHLRVPVASPPPGGRPLLILLHGAAHDAADQSRYMGFAEVAEASNILYAYADGSRLPGIGSMIWNGYGCCQVPGIGAAIDDVGYIDAIINAVIAAGNPVSQVWLVGHSNGGFLANRYACERSRTSARVSAIVTLGAPTWAGTSNPCPHTGGRVSVLSIRGTNDELAAYYGGTVSWAGTSLSLPSAETSIGEWATFNGCGSTMVPLGSGAFDLDLAVAGSETKPFTFPGCTGPGSVDFWIMGESHHIPDLIRPPAAGSFASRVVTWLSTH
jgi:polyhydroxybutyrate depolymerase